MRPEEQSEKVGSCRKNLQNTVEMAKKAETDIRTE